MPLRRTAFALVLAPLAALTACRVGPTPDEARVATGEVSVPQEAPVPTRPALASAAAPDLRFNELGRIPVLEYHLIGEKNATYERTVDGLRQDLELLYARGYRPVSMSEMIDGRIDLPAGRSPVVLVFDDASPSHFRYIERNGALQIDPTSAVGILLEFNRRHPEWRNRAVFCTLSGAEAGRSFFGDKGIEGQKTEWRFRKIRFLAEQGFELCNHTLWHARLSKYDDAMVQEQIARGQMAIDSAVPGYRVRTFALPQGMWPKRRELAWQGEWQDAKTKRVIRYRNEAVLEVAGGPSRSPHDPAFNPRSIPRVQVIGDSAVSRTLAQIERAGERYVSDGNASAIARPAPVIAARKLAPRSNAATGTVAGDGSPE